MSRKSVIQLVPAPITRGNASDLRYRLLMAALGSSEEVNPLLLAAESIDGAIEPPETAASPDHPNQTISAAELNTLEDLAVAKLEGQALPVTLGEPAAPSPAVQPPASSQAPDKTATEAPAVAGRTPLPRAPRRR
jgi:hypothetical protein